MSLSTGFCTIFLQIRPLCWPHSWLRHSCGQHSGLICKKIVRKPVESDAHCSKKLLQCSNVTVSVVKYHFSYRRSWQQLCSHGRHSGGAEGAQAPPEFLETPQNFLRNLELIRKVSAKRVQNIHASRKSFVKVSSKSRLPE